jgi:tetratricopeptide (TPR) repeat protein
VRLRSPPPPPRPPARREVPSPLAADDQPRAKPAGAERARQPKAADEVTLRLAIGRDGIGLELAAPVRIGCARVTQVTTALPTVRFPIDVSGGVARFRHRLGELRQIEVEVTGASLERWAAPRLRGLVSARTPEVWVGVRAAGATICVAAPVEPDRAGVAPVLAFDVDLLAEDDDLVLVVDNARGADLPAPATSIAIGCIAELLGGAAERRGAAFVVRSAAAALAKAVLPEAGARAPTAEGVRWTGLGADRASWVLTAAAGAAAAEPSEQALRAREVARVLEDADDALVRGAVDEARAACMVALEHVPRHAEIVRRVLEIDARTQGRAEAALATLAEARAAEPSARFGLVPAELLLQRGDRDAAMASFEGAAAGELAPALAAKAFELAARVASDPEASARWLDGALARAPRSTTARWARAERRLSLGRLEDALADLEHLEALARGPHAKHAVWIRAGRMWAAAGLAGRAARIFERALRYVPDEPATLAGLGAALVAEGSSARGVALLVRAIELADATAQKLPRASLDLAVALADGLDDLPSAIARAASIPGDAPESVIGKGLEGRWRLRLGDIVGAGLSFARMREALAARASAADVDAVGSGAGIKGLLAEAARMETVTRGDPLAAQRYLAEAVRLYPHDAELRQAYREAGAAVAGRPGPVPSPPAPRTAPAREVESDPESRVEELTRRLHAAPGDDEVADELADLLERLDRGHELLALLSGRLEDASPERRAVLAPRACAAMQRLASQAERDGRKGEAELFTEAARALTDAR